MLSHSTGRASGTLAFVHGAVHRIDSEGLVLVSLASCESAGSVAAEHRDGVNDGLCDGVSGLRVPCTIASAMARGQAVVPPRLCPTAFDAVYSFA